MDDFNPYREWLDLDDGPAPDYYTLLSLPAFADDRDQLAAAAARATTRVRSFRPGAHAREWSRLLDEIQAAQRCLCDPTAKSQYDDELRRGVSESASDKPAATDNTPASALAHAQSDLYPPGMSRPAAARSAPLASESLLPEAESFGESLPAEGLLPLSTSPIAALPLAATPDYLPVPSADAWPAESAIPYGIVPAALPGMPLDPPAGQPMDMAQAAMPVARSYGTYPATTAEDGPIAAATTVDSESFASPAAEVAVSSSPSPATFAARRRQERGFGLVLAGVSVLGLLAAAGAAYIFLVKPTTPAIAKNQAKAIVESAKKPSHPASSAKSPVPWPSPADPPGRTTAPLDTDSAPMSASLPFSDLPVPMGRSPESTSTPTPEPPPKAPPPESTPAPPAPASQPPEPTKIARADVQSLIKALEAAKVAYTEQNFKAADLQITKAESLAKLAKHRQAVARLKEAGGYVKQFREAVAEAVKGMQAGSGFKVGSSTQVSFVEGFPDKVILRTAGTNRTYPFNDMPPGLAVAIADMRLPADSPASKVVKGAYLLLHKRADSQTQEKAKSLWQEAKAGGADIDHLLPLLSENYAEFTKDATM